MIPHPIRAHHRMDAVLTSLAFFHYFVLYLRKTVGLPWWSSGQDSAFSLPGAQVQSQVEELRSLKLCGTAKKNGKKEGAAHPGVYTVSLDEGHLVYKALQ